jgi:hypothetical protein
MTDTLKSICERCPYLNEPQLDFIPDSSTRERTIIARDLSELVSAAAAELEKTVTVLAASILEAVLYTFLKSREAYIAKRREARLRSRHEKGDPLEEAERPWFKFNPEQDLSQYVSIFNRWFRDVLPNAVLLPVVVSHRDLVHFNQELKSAPDICPRAAREMLRILNAFLGELAQFASPPQEQAVTTK